MKQLQEYLTESLKSISTNALSTWRSKVATPEYYHGELTSNHYIRPLINALVGTNMTKVNRRRKIGDFVEMYFGNYISVKDGSFTLARVKEIEYQQDSRNYKAIVTVDDKWFAGLLARFTFKVHVNDPEKYFSEDKPEGNATLTIIIDTPVYKDEKEVSWKSTRPISVEVPVGIPQNDPLYMELAKQMSAQTRDMNWGLYDPIKNRYSKEEPQQFFPNKK